MCINRRDYKSDGPYCERKAHSCRLEGSHAFNLTPPSRTLAVCMKIR